MSDPTQRDELYTLWWKEAHNRAIKLLCKVDTASEIVVAGAIERHRASAYADVPATCHDEMGRQVYAPPGHPSAGVRTYREAEGTYILTDEAGEQVSEYVVRVAGPEVQVCNHEPAEREPGWRG